MAALKWIKVLIVGVLAIIVDNSHAQKYFPTFLDNPIITQENVTVFELGKYSFTKSPIEVSKRRFSAPEEMIIVSPTEAGSYPLLLFIHGTMISNHNYAQLFFHIASHGYIVVAPQLFNLLLPSQQSEIDRAASVANWLPSNLNQVLQTLVGKGVKGDFNKIAVSGHSRGGKSAFALVLGLTKNTKLQIKFSALIGVDPVAGSSKNDRTKPYVLTYKPNSLDLVIPVTVIGTGKGNVTRIMKPCAPNQVNHQQFFDDSKKASHFVIMDFGHMQMLNDRLDFQTRMLTAMCASGDGPKSSMRSTLGGIMVAFLDAYYGDSNGQYLGIMANPSLAPTEIFVQNKGNVGFSSTYAKA